MAVSAINRCTLTRRLYVFGAGGKAQPHGEHGLGYPLGWHGQHDVHTQDWVRACVDERHGRQLDQGSRY